MTSLATFEYLKVTSILAMEFQVIAHLGSAEKIKIDIQHGG